MSITSSITSAHPRTLIGFAAVAGLAARVLAESAPVSEPVPDAHTLLLAHYDNGPDADYARGNAAVLKLSNRGGAVLVPGRFGQGLSIPEGAFGVAYAPAGNINPRHGTVEFWLKGTFPDPDSDDPRKFWLSFFHAGCDQTGLGIWRSQYNHVGASIAYGYRSLVSLIFGNAGADRINDGHWHHLAVTWDREHVALFLDGRRKASSEKPVYPPVDNWCDGAIYVGYAPFDDYEYNASTNHQAYRPRSAQAVLDELRISDTVRYVADFIPPDKPFGTNGGDNPTVASRPVRPVSPGAVLPVFEADFGAGMDGWARVFGTNGQSELRTVTAGVSGGIELVPGRTGLVVRLHATKGPGDALYYPTSGLVTPFLGTLACRLKVAWPPDDGCRHIILDLCTRSRTGYLLEKTADGRLSFRAQERGRVLTEIQAPAHALCDGAWHTLEAAWHTQGLRLVLDGREVAASSQAVPPSVLGQHLFVGSCYEAVDQLDGLVERVWLELPGQGGLAGR